MKRIGILMSVGLATMMTASPLAAQTVKEQARVGQNPDQVLKRSMQAYSESVKAGLSKDLFAKGINFQSQITLGSPFWRNPDFAKTLNLTADQQKKMEDVFQQHRLKLIDLNGSLAKEESVLNALMADPRIDEETRVLSQIDRVAQARAELEKANARMLLGLRQVLTTEQWSRLSPSTTAPAGRGTNYRFQTP